MPVSKNAYRRFILIDRELRRKRYPGLDRLAEIGDVSKEQIKKDIEQLRLGPWHAPIAHDKGRKGYYYTEATFILPAFFITGSQLETLKLLGSLLLPFQHSAVYADYQKLLGSLSAFLAPEQVQYLAPDHKAVLIQPIFGADERLTEIFQAVETQNELEFMYRSEWAKTDEPRHVRPYALKLHGNNWFLLAYDIHKSGFRTYYVAKIKKLKTLNEVFLRDANFDAEQYYATSIGTWRDTGQKAEKLVVDVAEFAAFRFEQAFGDRIRKQTPLFGDWTRIELKLQLNAEVLSQLFAFMDTVRVLEPEWFVGEYKRVLGEMALNSNSKRVNN